MENNKQYNTSNKVHFSMLMALLVLGSLFRTTFAARRMVLSLEASRKPICHYFKKIPTNEYFEYWIKKVRETVAKYKLEAYLKYWLKDIDELEKIITSLNKEGKSNMSFVAMIQQHQEKEQSNYSMTCSSYPKPLSDEQSGKLVSIGKLSPANFVSENPIIAILDELDRVSLRFRPRETYNRCIRVAEGELGDEHVMTKRLKLNIFKELAKNISSLASGVSSAASSLLNMFTANNDAPEKDHKND